MAGFDTQRVIAAYQAGQQMKRQKELKVQDDEDRKFDLEKRALELKVLKFGEKERQRKEAVEQAQMMQGQPARTQQAGEPGTTTPNVETPEGAAPMIPSPIASGFTQEIPHEKITIPGVYGPDTQVQPQTMEQLLMQARQKQVFDSQLKRQESAVQLPDGSVVDKSIAGPLINAGSAAAGRTQTQTFTAGENEKNRTAATTLQTQRDSAAARRTERAVQGRIQAAQAAMGSGILTPKQTSMALQIGGKLQSHPAYADMQDVSTGLDGVSVGLSAKTGLGDITAINAFQRMVDPGATVREGDVALIQSATALSDKILSEYPVERLRSGAQLPDPTRKQMLDVAKALYERRAKNYNDSVGNQFRQLAGAAGIPFEYVGQDFAVGQQGSGAKPPSMKLPNGAVLTLQPDGSYQ